MVPHSCRIPLPPAPRLPAALAATPLALGLVAMLAAALACLSLFTRVSRTVRAFSFFISIRRVFNFQFFVLQFPGYSFQGLAFGREFLVTRVVVLVFVLSLQLLVIRARAFSS